MSITDAASNIWKFELDEDSDISIAFIAQWLRVNIGKLNNLINNGYYINDSYEIVDENGVEIDGDALAIYTHIFLNYFFTKQTKLYLGANGIDSVTQITQDGVTFRGVERNGIAKSYIELKKQNNESLKSLVNNYKFNRARAGHVKGDDYISKYDVVDPE